MGALCHILSPLNLQHGPRGSQIDKKLSTGLNTYTTINIYVWRPSEGGILPIKAQCLSMNTLTLSPPGHKPNKDTKGTH